MKIFPIILVITLLRISDLLSQTDCGAVNGIVYGSQDVNERGYCIAATSEGDGLYIAGIKEDSILLLKVDLNGAVQWSRTLDLVPGSKEYPYSLIVDSEGMLAVAGTTDDTSVGGPVFTLRYNPHSHQVLWSKQYISCPNSVPGSIIQKGIGGNYLLVNDLNIYSANHIDVELLEINISTGVVVPSVSKK